MSALSVRAFPRCLRTLMKLNGDCGFVPRYSVRNYWRRNVFSELSSAMQNVERNMRDMDKEISRVFDDIQRVSPVKLPRFFSPLEHLGRREIPVVSTDNDGRSYRLELDMDGMQPEDIKVSLKDRELTIKARREEKRSDGSRFVRENQYSYVLPQEVNPETVVSRLSGGVLTIEAPLPVLESKEIPINIDSSESSSESDSDKETKK